MIKKDNIKDFAILAFRYYGHHNADDEGIDVNEQNIINAVTNTFRHLKIENDVECVDVVKEIYCSLPLGNIRKGFISQKVIAVSNVMNMDGRTIWRKLRRARELFNAYYNY